MLLSDGLLSFLCLYTDIMIRLTWTEISGLLGGREMALTDPKALGMLLENGSVGVVFKAPVKACFCYSDGVGLVCSKIKPQTLCESFSDVFSSYETITVDVKTL